MVSPPESEALARRICVPTVSESSDSGLPVPIEPSMLDVHTSSEARLPSSASVAVARSTTVVPCSTDKPPAGADIATTGGVLIGVTGGITGGMTGSGRMMMESSSVAGTLSLSVTEAVMM